MSESWALEKKEENKQKAMLVVKKAEPAGSSITLTDRSPLRVSNTDYEPFISQGLVSLVGEENHPQSIHVLRDTGASQSLLLEGVLPLSNSSYTGSNVLLQGVELGVVSVPLHVVNLKTNLVSGPVMVGIRSSLSIQGVSLILDNDLAGERVMANPCVSAKPELNTNPEETKLHVPGVFPSCAITRAMARQLKESEVDRLPNVTDEGYAQNLTESSVVGDQEEPEINLLGNHDMPVDTDGNPPLTHSQLIRDQQADPELVALSQTSITEEEAQDYPVCYFKRTGVLMHKWRPPSAPAADDLRVVYQILVPKNCRRNVLELAHSTPMAGHLGVNKIYNRIQTHFYWPGIKNDVQQFCRSCHVCQLVGKPNQKVPVAPLQPIRAVE